MSLLYSSGSPNYIGVADIAAATGWPVVLVLDVDVPWLPQFVKENPRTFWVQVDVDAIKKDSNVTILEQPHIGGQLT